MERTVKRRRTRAFPGPLNLSVTACLYLWDAVTLKFNGPENARVPRTVELERYGVPVLVGRSEPTSIDLTDQCFDRFGGLGWQLFLGFGADDHFFCDAGRLGSLQGGKVRAPPCGI